MKCKAGDFVVVMDDWAQGRFATVINRAGEHEGAPAWNIRFLDGGAARATDRVLEPIRPPATAPVWESRTGNEEFHVKEPK